LSKRKFRRETTFVKKKKVVKKKIDKPKCKKWEVGESKKKRSPRKKIQTNQEKKVRPTPGYQNGPGGDRRIATFVSGFSGIW